MARLRTIIGIGEALLAEYPDRVEPAGIALEVARAAALLGHRGLAISRLGQDAVANELHTILAGQTPSIDIKHLQSDPDLPTGRLIVRSIAGRTRETLDHRAAFDNLQWDFDLIDVAKEADAVVFGMLAQRGGQSSSIISRFLAEATRDLVVCDLTNRADDTFERSLALRSLDMSQFAVVDTTAWSILKLGPHTAPEGESHEEAARVLMRQCELTAVVWLDPNQSMEVHTSEGISRMESGIERAMHPMAVTALLHAFLRGEATSEAVASVQRIVAHARDHPKEEIPESVRR